MIIFVLLENFTIQKEIKDGLFLSFGEEENSKK